MHRHIGTHLTSKARLNNSFTALLHMTSFTSSAQFLLLIKKMHQGEKPQRRIKMKEKERKVGGGQLLEGGLLS